MNIAILIPELGGGGAERVAQRIGDYFWSIGHKVFYFLGNYGVHAVYEVKGKIVKTGLRPIYNWRKESYFFTFDQLWHDAKIMKKFKRQYEIDVSISFMEHFNALNVLSCCGDKIIIRVCTILSARSLSGALYNRRMITLLYNRANKVIAMTEDGVDELSEIYGIAKGKITLIANPVYAENIAVNNLLTVRRKAYSKKHIVLVGRLEPVKQQASILRAFSEVVKHVSRAKLIILGQGPLEHEIKGLAKQLQLENKIMFMGFVKNVEHYLIDASVMVITSKCEGFPNAMIEAMALGVPIVASESPGGVREILQGRYVSEGEVRKCPFGIMTPAMPEGACKCGSELNEAEHILAKAISDLLENEKLYMEMSEKAYCRAQDYAVDKIMDKWERLL